MEDNNKHENKTSRKDFLRKSLLTGGVLAAGALGLQKALSKDKDTGEKVKVLTPDGKLVEVDSGQITECHSGPGPDSTTSQARMGIPGKKYIMVIDLSRCKHALKCQDSCQRNHHLSGMNVWLKVFKMHDSENTALTGCPSLACIAINRPV